MRSPAENAAILIQDAGVGHTTTPTANAWAIKIGRLIQAPHAMIVLTDTGGFNPNTKWLLDFPTVQALVRGEPDAYQAAYYKAQQVKDVLLGLEPQAIGTAPIPPAEDTRDWWSGVTMLSDVTYVTHDENSRPIFSVNFRILQERKPNSLTNRQALDDPS